MLTLSYGFLKPQTPDKGPVVFPAMEFNIQQLNDHTHDGTNSAKLSAAALAPTTSTALAANWVDQGGGNYKQTVNMPPGYMYDFSVMSFRYTDGTYVFPSIHKVSPTVFDIFTNDPTQAVVIYYGV